MTKTQTQPQEVAPSPYAERHRLRSELTAARVANDTARGQLSRLREERKEAEDDAFKHEMALVTGTEGAQQFRDAAVERLRGLDTAQPQYERALAAAEQLLQILQGKLELLHRQEFESFRLEAESATHGAETELRELRRQVSRCAESWGKAASLWRPLAGALREQLEELNRVEGQYPDLPGQCVVRPFPIDITFLENLAPRPRGIERLRRAERTDTSPAVTSRARS